MCSTTGTRSSVPYVSCTLMLIAFLLIWNTPLAAQTATGRIAGLMEDPSGAVVQGGEIEVRNLDSGFKKLAVTDHEGRYVLDAIPVGR